jgi:two-component system, LytTR family, sensor histidine kinase AlgZ
MNAPVKGRWSAPWILFSCILLGALPGLVGLILGSVSLREFGLSAFVGSIYALSIGIPCWTVIPRVLCSLDARPLGVRLGVVLPMLALFGVAGCLITNLIMLALHITTGANFSANFWSGLKISLLITFVFTLANWGIMTLQERLAEANAELHKRQIGEERERKIAAEARFASLESRVHPHFLFNTLNSISALVREDPAEAERMIERLAALLRYSLDSELSGVVALREELRIVRDYLEIEKVRFGDRLRYRIEADEAAGSQTVPALSVQTLVQNSVKYAVGALRDGAEILVSARVENGHLRVEVSDDGPGFEPASSLKPGHGLDLLQRRLASLFGSSASLEMTAREGHTLIAICVTG